MNGFEFGLEKKKQKKKDCHLFFVPPPPIKQSCLLLMQGQRNKGGRNINSWSEVQKQRPMEPAAVRPLARPSAKAMAGQSEADLLYLQSQILNSSSAPAATAVRTGPPSDSGGASPINSKSFGPHICC